MESVEEVDTRRLIRRRRSGRPRPAARATTEPAGQDGRPRRGHPHPDPPTLHDPPGSSAEGVGERRAVGGRHRHEHQRPHPGRQPTPPGQPRGPTEQVGHAEAHGERAQHHGDGPLVVEAAQAPALGLDEHGGRGRTGPLERDPRERRPERRDAPGHHEQPPEPGPTDGGVRPQPRFRVETWLRTSQISTQNRRPRCRVGGRGHGSTLPHGAGRAGHHRSRRLTWAGSMRTRTAPPPAADRRRAR